MTVDRASARRSAWRLVAGLAGLAVIAQLWGLYRVAGPPSAPWFPHADKLQHAVGFGLPVALLLLALGLRAVEHPARPSGPALRLIVGVFAVHAVTSEVVQHLFYLSRSGDPLDALADLVGVALGTALALGVLRRTTGSSVPGMRAAEPTGAAAP